MLLTADQWIDRLRRVLGGGNNVRPGDGLPGRQPEPYETHTFQLADATNDFLQVIPQIAYDTIDVAWAYTGGATDGGTPPGMLISPGLIRGAEGVHAYSTVAASAAQWVRQYPPMWVIGRQDGVTDTQWEGATRLEVDLTSDPFAVAIRGGLIDAPVIIVFRITLRTLRH